MADLRRVRPGIGGSGTFQGPIGGHFSHQVQGTAEYFLQTTLTPDWQDMYNPIHTRKIIDRQKDRQLQLQQSLTQESPPTPMQYYRARTRIR